MKRIASIVLFLCSAAFAQDRWVGHDPIGGGSIFLYPEPSFASDSGGFIFADMIYPTGDLRIYIGHGFGGEVPLLPESLSVVGCGDISPYMTNNGTRLYFSSNRPGGFGGYDIWMTEKVSEAWSIPINLGSEINSSFDDLSPSLTSNENELIFVKGTFSYSEGAWGHIFKSSFQDGHWTTPDSIPVPVFSANDDASPSISSDGNLLYFISKRPNGIPRLDYGAWVSVNNENDNWSEPALLTGFINEYTIQLCNFNYWDTTGIPTSCEINPNSNCLLYNKLDWYVSMGICYDWEDNFYQSYREVNIEDSPIIAPQYFNIELYPNPFNSSLAINIDGSVSEVAIYNLLGQCIRTYANTGSNTIIWDGRSDEGITCASGIYFVRAASGERAIVKTATMLK